MSAFFSLPENPLTKNNIGGSPKDPHRQFWKEDLFVKYDKNKNVNPLSASIPIKYLPDGTKVLLSLIVPSIKEGHCSYEWKFFACHCANGSY